MIFLQTRSFLHKRKCNLIRDIEVEKELRNENPILFLRPEIHKSKSLLKAAKEKKSEINSVKRIEENNFQLEKSKIKRTKFFIYRQNHEKNETYYKSNYSRINND